MTHYAWSKFNTKYNEHGQATETLMPGDTITQAKLGISDEEWNYLIEVGAVREEEYPDIAADTSPAEAARAKALQGFEPEYSDESVEELLMTRDSGTVSGEVVNEDTVKASADKAPAKAASESK